MADVVWKDRKRIIFGLPWTFTRYSLTQEKLTIDTGFISRKEDEIRLYRILDITLQRPLHQRDVYELPSGRRCHRVFVSALKGEGLGVLREVLADAALHGLQGGLDAPPQRDPRFDMHNASHEPVPDAAPPRNSY